jgi:hypothetical protein
MLDTKFIRLGVNYFRTSLVHQQAKGVLEVCYNGCIADVFAMSYRGRIRVDAVGSPTVKGDIPNAV